MRKKMRRVRQAAVTLQQVQAVAAASGTYSQYEEMLQQLVAFEQKPELLLC